jgi:hypothetical protein
LAHVGKRARHRVTFAVLSVGVSAFAVLQSLVIPVLTTVQEQFHASPNAATWVLTACLVSASVFTPEGSFLPLWPGFAFRSAAGRCPRTRHPTPNWR